MSQSCHILHCHGKVIGDEGKEGEIVEGERRRRRRRGKEVVDGKKETARWRVERALGFQFL